ncbi:MAG: hypothetical protein WBC21_03895 [Minisyncoccales bacterium]
MKNKITKNTTLLEILKCPEAKEILAEYEVPCVFCPMARFEMENLTLGEICTRYNINLKDLLKRLNKVLEK